MGWNLGVLKTESRESTETSQRKKKKPSIISVKSVRKQQGKPAAGTTADTRGLT